VFSKALAYFGMFFKGSGIFLFYFVAMLNKYMLEVTFRDEEFPLKNR